MINFETQKSYLKNEFGLSFIGVNKGATIVYIMELLVSFVINVIVVQFLFKLFLSTQTSLACAIGLVLFLAVCPTKGLIIKIYKKMNGVKDAPLEVENRLKYILKPMVAKAGIRMPRIYIVDVDYPNACIFGKSDIAITIPILELPNEALAGILAHEVAHLRNLDSVKSIRICTMNIALMVLQGIFGFIAWILQRLGKSISFFNIVALPFVFIMLFFTFLQSIPEKIGLFQQEFKADAATVEFGQGENFICGISMLSEMLGEVKNPGIITRLRYFWSSTHPPTYDRIKKVKALLVAEA